MRSLYLTICSVFFSVLINNINAQSVYEAEKADVIFQGVIETEHTGFSGSGYVNGDNIIGSYIEWAVSMAAEGQQSLSFTYALGATDARNMQLSVNGVDIAVLNFAPSGDWINYIAESVNATLSSGLNLVRITSISSSGGPNIDKMETTGDAGEKYARLNINIYGAGSVTYNPVEEYYAISSQVELIAQATNDTAFFAGWRGNATSEDENITIAIDTSNTYTAIFMPYNVLAKTNELVGWCGYDGITMGGEGGSSVTVTNQSELESAVSGSASKIVQIEGTITITPIGKEISVGSNKTMFGLGSDATLKGGGLKVADVNNVIIRNLTFKDAYVTWDGKTTDNDGIEVNNSHHVWIDHCDLSHFDDGLIDIKNGSDYVTVSWCHFHNHNKVMLIGSSDDSPQDVGHLNVTAHHNWFDGSDGNGIGQRLPLGRYGKIHMFNNYYQDVLVRGVECAYDGNIVVDNNYFLNVEMPHALTGGATGGDNKMNATGNIYVNCGSRRDKNGQAFNPSDFYDYSYNKASDVPIIVMLGAGINADTLIGRIDTTLPPYALSEVISSGRNVLSIYPNPVKENLTVDFTIEKTGWITLQLLDLSGKVVAMPLSEYKNRGDYSLDINLARLSAGVYFVKFVQSDNIQTKRIIHSE